MRISFEKEDSSISWVFMLSPNSRFLSKDDIFIGTRLRINEYQQEQTKNSSQSLMKLNVSFYLVDITMSSR